MRPAVPITSLLAAIALSTASIAAAGAASPQAGLAGVRQATARYHNPAAAIAAGYMATNECVEVPGTGAMGYHYVNLGLLDATVDLRQPEVLLYAPSPSGPRLVAVEWVVIDVDQPHPWLLGVPFDGPMPGHVPGMPVHYDLHAWIWQPNPNGLFAPFNPRLSCSVEAV